MGKTHGSVGAGQSVIRKKYLKKKTVKEIFKLLTIIRKCQPTSWISDEENDHSDNSFKTVICISNMAPSHKKGSTQNRNKRE